MFKEESFSECNDSVWTMILFKKTIRKDTLTRPDKFKAGLRESMKRNIQIKPTLNFPVLRREGGRPPAPPAPRLTTEP